MHQNNNKCLKHREDEHFTEEPKCVCFNNYIEGRGDVITSEHMTFLNVYSKKFKPMNIHNATI